MPASNAPSTLGPRPRSDVLLWKVEELLVQRAIPVERAV
jgi:hypothetical protein